MAHGHHAEFVLAVAMLRKECSAEVPTKAQRTLGDSLLALEQFLQGLAGRAQ